jgi:hypothetical protein
VPFVVRKSEIASRSWQNKMVTVQCGRARSHIPAGVNPAPARQASHWIEDPGPAGVIPKVKHRAIKTTGRKRKLK